MAQCQTCVLYGYDGMVPISPGYPLAPGQNIYRLENSNRLWTCCQSCNKSGDVPDGFARNP